MEPPAGFWRLKTLAAHNDSHELARPRGKVPISRHPLFTLLVSAWFGALLGLSCMAVNPALIGLAVTKLQLDQFIPALAPPLSLSTQAVLALVLFLCGAFIGQVLARRISLPRSARESGPVANSANETSIRLRTADAHPDAPARRPILASEEFGDDTAAELGEDEDFSRLNAARTAQEPADFRPLPSLGEAPAEAPTETAAVAQADPEEADAPEIEPEVLDLSALAEVASPDAESTPEAKPVATAPAPTNGAALIMETPIESLGLVELVERLALAFDRRANSLDEEASAEADSVETIEALEVEETVAVADDELPTDEPLQADEPSAIEPVTEELPQVQPPTPLPPAAQPMVVEPTALEPSSELPELPAAEPTTAELTAAEMTADEPAAVGPSFAEAVADEPAPMPEALRPLSFDEDDEDEEPLESLLPPRRLCLTPLRAVDDDESYGEPYEEDLEEEDFLEDEDSDEDEDEDGALPAKREGSFSSLLSMKPSVRRALPVLDDMPTDSVMDDPVLSVPGLAQHTPPVMAPIFDHKRAAGAEGIQHDGRIDPQALSREETSNSNDIEAIGNDGDGQPSAPLNPRRIGGAG
jgi:hypothetical protein